MTVIREFSDFHLFAINPYQGVIVTGFGSAFNVTGNDFRLESRLSSNG
jgi:putative heme iron utilization protein